VTGYASEEVCDILHVCQTTGRELGYAGEASIAGLYISPGFGPVPGEVISHRYGVSLLERVVMPEAGT